MQNKISPVGVASKGIVKKLAYNWHGLAQCYYFTQEIKMLAFSSKF